MAKNESVQRKLQKIRPPRVQMTYDVEIGDAIEKKELAFVTGVVGDFSGKSEIPQAKLKDRSFVSIDLISVFPDGSPTIAVPPPSNAIGLWPAFCICAINIIAIKCPTCKLSAVGSKPI